MFFIITVFLLLLLNWKKLYIRIHPSNPTIKCNNKGLIVTQFDIVVRTNTCIYLYLWIHYKSVNFSPSLIKYVRHLYTVQYIYLVCIYHSHSYFWSTFYFLMNWKKKKKIVTTKPKVFDVINVNLIYFNVSITCIGNY